MKNQKFFSSLTAVLLVASFSAQTTAQINITPSTTTGQVYLIKAALEGRGVVQPEENQSLQMDVDARFQY